MSDPRPPALKPIPARLVDTVCRRLADDRQVRRSLPGWGRVHIDRQLPFLCVYRRPPNRRDEGTSRLVVTQASYLFAGGERALHASLTHLVQEVGATLAQVFGAFLIIEIWSAPAPAAPVFRIVGARADLEEPTVGRLQRALQRIKIARRPAAAEVAAGRRVAPPGLSQLVAGGRADGPPLLLLGLEVPAVFRDEQTGEVFPLVLRSLRRGLSRALQQAFYEFSRTRTIHQPPHYHALGRRAVTQAVWEVDRQLAKVSDAFDFLLQVTPVNSEAAWRSFRRARCERAPAFDYRPLPVDPLLVKRQLYAVPIERVEDPTLFHLFQEKQLELDRQLTMLLDRDSPRFLYGSLQLFGGVEDELLEQAQGLLERLSPRSREDSSRGHLNAEAFAVRAREEVGHYRRLYPEFAATVQVRDDTYAGLLVSRGRLLIGRQSRIPVARAEALLQHEVGTHLVTYFNGRAQPFQQLYAGLAGYEELQEGLAVLAEHLVGGLSRPRLRMLAARVIAVRAVTEGASFVETFRHLDRDLDISQRTAFLVTMRVHRGGGLTKDAIYLRGLQRLLEYVRAGGALEPLLVGKIAVDHVPLVRELQWRRILQPAPVRPRYLDHPQAARRLERLRASASLLDLITRR